MQITLYHGSEHIIEKPLYHGGKRYNDYGYGFFIAPSVSEGRCRVRWVAQWRNFWSDYNSGVI